MRHLPRKRSLRRGAALLVLVVMVLLVLVAATRSLVMGEVMTRRGEADRIRARSMMAAIDAVSSKLRRPDADSSFNTLRLPIDATSDEYIEISVSDDKTKIMARWHKGDQVIDEMRRSLENMQAESSQ